MTNLYWAKQVAFERFILVSGAPYPALFWLGFVGLGSAVPLALLFHPRLAGPRATAAASRAGGARRARASSTSSSSAARRSRWRSSPATRRRAPSATARSTRTSRACRRSCWAWAASRHPSSSRWRACARCRSCRAAEVALAGGRAVPLTPSRRRHERLPGFRRLAIVRQDDRRHRSHRRAGRARAGGPALQEGPGLHRSAVAGPRGRARLPQSRPAPAGRGRGRRVLGAARCRDATWPWSRATSACTTAWISRERTATPRWRDCSRLPVVLVLDGRGMARGAAALLHGLATFDPSRARSRA